MKKVAILTDFINFDPAYSLCRVVRDQVKALVSKGYEPLLLVREGFDADQAQFYPGAKIATVRHGETGSNKAASAPTYTRRRSGPSGTSD